MLQCFELWIAKQQKRSKKNSNVVDSATNLIDLMRNPFPIHKMHSLALYWQPLKTINFEQSCNKGVTMTPVLIDYSIFYYT